MKTTLTCCIAAGSTSIRLLAVIGLAGALFFSPPTAIAQQHSEPTGHLEQADSEQAWCARHSLPEDECFICNPDLREKGRLWCREHGRYEDRCWLCHPELEDPERPYCQTHFLYSDECAHLHTEKTTEQSRDHADPEKSEAGNTLWCATHSLPEEECFICHPELREKDRLWCREHGRYEDRCWLCHPELEDPERPYCKMHFLYFDECAHFHESNSGTVASQKQKTARAEPRPALYCKEHDLPEHECGICHPDLIGEPGEAGMLKVRLPSKQSQELLEIQLQKPEAGTGLETLSVYGKMQFNQNRTAQIISSVRGVIKEVHAELGQQVAAGRHLVSLWSPLIARTASNAVLAAQRRQREQRLRDKKINSVQDLEEAEAAYRAAVQELQSLGFQDSQIGEFLSSPNDSAVLYVTAPFAGTIIDRSAVQGEFVAAGDPLFTITDPESMWAMLDIPEGRLQAVTVGQSVRILPAGNTVGPLAGTISWISADIDPHSRTGTARVDLSSAGGQLRNNMFVEAEIQTGQSPGSLLVPQSALQRIGQKEIVFIQLEPDVYGIVPVTVGRRMNNQAEIHSGLLNDQPVVVNRSYALKSQLLVSKLGAGCVH